jgi:hypothetical protein
LFVLEPCGKEGDHHGEEVELRVAVNEVLPPFLKALECGVNGLDSPAFRFVPLAAIADWLIVPTCERPLTYSVSYL